MTKSKTQKKDEQTPNESKVSNVEKPKGKTPKSKEPVVEQTTQKTKTKSKSKDTPTKTKSKSKTVDGSDDEKNVKRSFKGIYVNCEGVVVLSGRYCGKKPMQAARKALTGIYRLYNNFNKQHPKNKKLLSGVIYFGVKETSRQSKHKKTYWYAGEKQELDVPHERILKSIDEKTGKNKVISHRSKNEVKKASLDECKHLLQYVEEDEVKPKAKRASKKTTDAKKVKKVKKVKEVKEVEEVVEEKPKVVAAKKNEKTKTKK